MPGKLLYLFLLLPCCLLLTAAAQQPDKPVRRNLGEKVTMLIPENFTQMPEDEMAQKYPSARKPVCIYTNPAHNVDISLNISNTVWGENDIEMLRDFYRSNIKQLYTKVTFSIDEIQKINKRRYVVFEFISESSEKESGKPSIRKYTYIQYTVLEGKGGKAGKVMVLHLDAPAGEAGIWQGIAYKLMHSVKWAA